MARPSGRRWGLSEVTLTLIDPELAEAAAFVLGTDTDDVALAGPVGVPESAYGSTAKGINTEDTENTEDGEEFRESVNGEIAQAVPGEDESSSEPKFLKKNRLPEKPAMNLKPGEVVVGRRLYRSGQSEYLINGRVARLRDIQDLFMGIGLGPDSYAIIEQGRIGQILSSKPTDRRAIIEEAAGITKFKTKRRLSEAKLESSKVNLSRINDIYVEVEKQLASLKRQASKARRYAEIREQMRGLLRQVLASKAKELDLEAERLSGLLGEISHQESQEAQSVSNLESEQERLSGRAYELEGELRQHQNVLGQTALELDRSENRILFNRQRTNELTGRRQQLSLEIEQASAQAAQVEARATAHGVSVTALQSDVARIETILTTLAAASAEISGAHDSTEARIATLRRSAAELGEELTRLHGEQAQAEQALAHHLEGVSRYEQQEQQLLKESLHHRERAAIRGPALAIGLEIVRAAWMKSLRTRRDASRLFAANNTTKSRRWKSPAMLWRQAARAALRSNKFSTTAPIPLTQCRSCLLRAKAAMAQMAFAPSACWPTTRRSNRSMKAPSSNFCAMSWNTS